MNIKNKLNNKIKIKKALSTKNVYGEREYDTESAEVLSRIEQEMVKRRTKDGEIEELKSVIYVDGKTSVNIGDLVIIEENGKIPLAVEVIQIIEEKDVKGNVILKKLLF